MSRASVSLSNLVKLPTPFSHHSCWHHVATQFADETANATRRFIAERQGQQSGDVAVLSSPGDQPGSQELGPVPASPAAPAAARPRYSVCETL